MPRVPVLDGPRVSPSISPTPYSNRDVRETGELAKGLKQFGRTAGKAIEDVSSAYTENIDAAQVMGGDSALGEWEKKNIYDPRNGYLAKNGEDALRGPDNRPLDEVYLEEFDKVSKSIHSGLSSDRQKEAFQKIATRRRERLYGAVSGHWGRQSDAVVKQKFDGAIDTSISDASNGYENEKTVDEARTLGEAAIRLRGAQQGLPGEAIEAERRAYLTKLHLSVLDRMVDVGDVEKAEAYLTKHGGEIDGKARGASNIDKVVATLKEDRRAEGLVKDALDWAADDSGRVDADAAMAQLELEAKGDVGLLDNARRRAQHQIMVREQAHRRESDEVSKAAYAQFNIGGWGGIEPRLKEDLNQRNPALYHQLKSEQERKYRQRNDDAGTRREQRTRDDIALKKYRALSTEEIADTDPVVFAAKYGASPLGIANLEVEQKKARGAVTSGDAQSINDFMAEAKAKGGVKSKTEAADFAAEARIEYENFREHHKRKPSREEANRLIANITSVGKTRPSALEFVGVGPGEEPEWKRRARERKEAAAKSGEKSPPEAKPGKAPEFEVIGPGGKRGMATEKWLSEHPDWKRR